MSNDAPSASKIQSCLLSMVRERGPEKSICPSEVARAVAPEDWRRSMDAVRDVAADLAEQGKVIVTQKGIPVDLNQVRGPIRIRLAEL